MQPDDPIKFLRRKDYKFVRELGEGACGKTVLLHDDLIGEDFACKKYSPQFEGDRQTLFTNFIQEIKLLYQISHQNIVRVFSYYLYPDKVTGYIVMEFVDGSDIGTYLKKAPEKANELFLQAIHGFSYLEARRILHRDIRPANLLVREDGVLKIIDFGFGKHVQDSENLGKSISLNWLCDPPQEFADNIDTVARLVHHIRLTYAHEMRYGDLRFPQ